MAKESRSLENALAMSPSVVSEASEVAGFLSEPDAAPKKKKTLKKRVAEKTSKRPSNSTETKAVSRAPFSTRLSEDLIEKLTLATVNRRLKKKSPWTQQAITEEALHDWLKRNDLT